IFSAAVIGLAGSGDGPATVAIGASEETAVSDVAGAFSAGLAGGFFARINAIFSAAVSGFADSVAGGDAAALTGKGWGAAPALAAAVSAGLATFLAARI